MARTGQQLSGLWKGAHTHGKLPPQYISLPGMHAMTWLSIEAMASDTTGSDCSFF